jgi:hypothetical protein
MARYSRGAIWLLGIWLCNPLTCAEGTYKAWQDALEGTGLVVVPSPKLPILLSLP